MTAPKLTPAQREMLIDLYESGPNFQHVLCFPYDGPVMDALVSAGLARRPRSSSRIVACLTAAGRRAAKALVSR
jgi:hypothetical protein